MDRSQFDKGVFLVLALGIVYDPKTKMILIGRRENDPYIPELTWSFPGGKLAYKEDMEFYLKEEILKKTGMEVTPNDVVFAKTYPEDRSFLSVYYLCTPTGGTLKAGGSFQDVRRVKPIEVEKYFTTSLSPKLLEYLKTLK